MLRPSRRQYHEQISQTEEHDGGGNLNSPTNQGAGGQGPSIVIINDITETNGSTTMAESPQ